MALFLTHDKDSAGKPCGGRIIFTDDPAPSPAFLNQGRTHERRCGACNYEEKYSDSEIVVIFCEGITEEQAVKLIKAIDRNIELIRTKPDRGNPNVIAVYIKARVDIIKTLESYEGKILAACRVLKH